MPWGDMLFVGWPRERLSELIPMHGKKLVGFAGAAFSGFSLLPVIASALYGAGKLGITGDPAQELQSTCDPKRSLGSTTRTPARKRKVPPARTRRTKARLRQRKTRAQKKINTHHRRHRTRSER